MTRLEIYVNSISNYYTVINLSIKFDAENVLIDASNNEWQNL